jgi:small subunit ribosomal protein S14
MQKKRAELKEIVKVRDAFEAAQKLQSVPRNASPIRLHNRCKLTVVLKAICVSSVLSRIEFREMASNGLIRA